MPGSRISWGSHLRQMEPARFVGELQITLRGDPVRGAALIPLARTLLGGLRQRLSLGGIDSGSHRIQLSGATIQVTCGIGLDLAWIVVPTGGVSVSGEGGFGFTFYPKTDAARAGVYNPTNAMVRYDNGQAMPPEVFVKLSRLFNAETRQLTLKVSKPTSAVTGNQFWFDGPDVYSWWHSPYGDGPMTDGVGLQYSPYRPFFHVNGGEFVYYTEQKALALVPLNVYKNGLYWQFLSPPYAYSAGVVIAGFSTVVVDLIVDGVPLQQKRYLVAFQSLVPPRVMIAVYRDGESGYLADIPVESGGNAYPGFLDGFVDPDSDARLWPIQFRPDGKELAFITYHAEGAYRVAEVVKIGLTHGAETVTMQSPAVTRYPLGTVTIEGFENLPGDLTTPVNEITDDPGTPIECEGAMPGNCGVSGEIHGQNTMTRWLITQGSQTTATPLPEPIALAYDDAGQPLLLTALTFHDGLSSSEDLTETERFSHSLRTTYSDGNHAYGSVISETRNETQQTITDQHTDWRRYQLEGAGLQLAVEVGTSTGSRTLSRGDFSQTDAMQAYDATMSPPASSYTQTSAYARHIFQHDRRITVGEFVAFGVLYLHLKSKTAFYATYRTRNQAEDTTECDYTFNVSISGNQGFPKPPNLQITYRSSVTWETQYMVVGLIDGVEVLRQAQSGVLPGTSSERTEEYEVFY